MRHRALPLAAVVALAPGLLRAQNLVTNPSFENGWNGYTLTLFNDETVTGPARADRYNAPAHTGAYVFVLDALAGQTPSGPAGFTLTQAIATTPGTAYQFSFWAYNLPGAGFAAASASLLFGDVTLMADRGVPPGAYRQYTAVAVATSALTTLTFSGYNDAGATLIDDLSVTAAPVTAAPEPATLALVAGGLAAVGLGRRHRRAG